MTPSRPSAQRFATGSSARSSSPPAPSSWAGPRSPPGSHTLLLAPTGSGKTLAAFLSALDGLARDPAERGTRVLYVSPLKALNHDIERNLRAPLAGITFPRLPTVALRSGDTSQRERAAIRRHPPDILITTPESLYLMLTSAARDVLRTVETVIVDEIHAVAATKRGAHLALSLERLEQLAGRPVQRIGLSATQRPLEEVARFLGGDREVAIVDAGRGQAARPGGGGAGRGHARAGRRAGRWTASPASRSGPPSTRRLLELVRSHDSTIVFVNNRRSAERVANRLNELAEAEIARAHHGSIAREQRLEVEDMLKRGDLPALVATSSLELGIDMGAVDLVVQIESPKSVAARPAAGGPRRALGRPGLARALLPEVARRPAGDGGGDAAHARGRDRAHAGAAPAAGRAGPAGGGDGGDGRVADRRSARAGARGAYPYGELSASQFEGVLEMLAGRYPSDEFAELRPRIVWDRTGASIRGRDSSRRLAVMSGGTIPDRGLYGVFLADSGARVGELDEEMVYEARQGEVFQLGATSWRIEQITRDRVLVSPAPGVPGKMPFWKGDGIGRPSELGRPWARPRAPAASASWTSGPPAT